jgi:hypothetical protein
MRFSQRNHRFWRKNLLLSRSTSPWPSTFPGFWGTYRNRINPCPISKYCQVVWESLNPVILFHGLLDSPPDIFSTSRSLNRYPNPRASISESTSSTFLSRSSTSFEMIWASSIVRVVISILLTSSCRRAICHDAGGNSGWIASALVLYNPPPWLTTRNHVFPEISQHFHFLLGGYSTTKWAAGRMRSIVEASASPDSHLE